MSYRNGQSPGDSQRGDLAVMEAEDFKQKYRLREILETVTRVEENVGEAWNDYTDGEISQHAVHITIQKNVQRAIRECYNLLIEYAGDQDGADYYWHGEEADPIGVIEFRQEDPLPIIGLADFLATKESYTEEWTEYVHNRHPKYRREEVRQATHTVPKEVSWAAFLRLKEFLSTEHGLEVASEQIEKDAEADPF